MKVYLLTCTLKGSSQRFRTECMCGNRSGWMDGWWKRCSRQVSDDDAHPRKQADCDPFVNFMKHHYKPYIVSQHANNSNKILTRLESAVCCIIHLLLFAQFGVRSSFQVIWMKTDLNLILSVLWLAKRQNVCLIILRALSFFKMMVVKSGAEPQSISSKIRCVIH